ncbi:hypothetical protein MUK42_30611, partial [Musa troglodytarum]
ESIYLETSSQRGALSVASRKVASISDRIFNRASVSCSGHRFPVTPPPPLSASSPVARTSSSGELPAKAGPSSSKFARGAPAGGRLLMGDAASASRPGISGSGIPYCAPPRCSCMSFFALSSPPSSVTSLARKRGRRGDWPRTGEVSNQHMERVKMMGAPTKQERERQEFFPET